MDMKRGEHCQDQTIDDTGINVDQVHLFIEFSPKYSTSFVVKRIKGVSSEKCVRCFRILRNGIKKVWRRHFVCIARSVVGGRSYSDTWWYIYIRDI